MVGSFEDVGSSYLVPTGVISFCGQRSKFKGMYAGFILKNLNKRLTLFCRLSIRLQIILRTIPCRIFSCNPYCGTSTNRILTYCFAEEHGFRGANS